MKRTKILPFVIMLLLASCKSEPEVAKAEVNEDREEIVVTKEQFEHNRMKLEALEEKDFPEILRVNGKIDVPPENRVQINVYEGGYVKRVPLLEGNSVRQGQLLLSLENTKYVELQQEYLELAGQLDYLKSEYERQQVMLAENITSKKNFLRVESQYKSGLARYNGLRKKLQMLNIDPQKVEAGKVTSEINIYSPISGTVDRVNVTKGMFVEPTHNILEIVNTDHLHLELNVFEKDLMKIAEGQKINFSLPQDPSASYEAAIWLVGRSIDEDRMSAIHAHLADSLKNKFAVGMFVEANIIIDSNTYPALPEEAIVEVDNAFYVLVLENRGEGNYIFTLLEINPGNTHNGFTAIKNPEALQGKKVLSKGAFNLIAS